MINADKCPANLKESINAYVEGRPTGGFLRAVIENDLRMAVMLADEDNLRLLPEIVVYVIDVVPTYMRCSKEAIAAHLMLCSARRNDG